MPEYDITLHLDVVVSRTIVADSLDLALASARKLDNPQAIFQPKVRVDYVDGDIEVKGVYEL